MSGKTTKTHSAAALLGRRGGKARAKNLTAEQRSAIAKKASRVAADRRRKKAAPPATDLEVVDV